MLVGGVLLLLSSAAAGALVGWENRRTVVRVQVGHTVWTGHLYAVLVVGALLACWFMLGVAFIQCRIAERRRMRAARLQAETTAEPANGRRSAAGSGGTRVSLRSRGEVVTAGPAGGR